MNKKLIGYTILLLLSFFALLPTYLTDGLAGVWIIMKLLAGSIIVTALLITAVFLISEE